MNTHSPKPKAAPDRLVDFRRFNEILGFSSRTSHTARSYARNGLIRAVRINARVVRYSENSILDLAGARGGEAT